MRHAVAVALICALFAPSLSAGQPEEVQWSNVRELSPGARMTLTREGEPSHTAQFLAADETGFKALNASDLQLPAGAAKALIRKASAQPDQLLSVAPGRSLRIEGDVVLSVAGLFDGTRKVAEYDRVIESISRHDLETGAVRLERAEGLHRMATSSKVLIGLGIAVAIPVVIFVAICTVGRCD